MACTHQPHVAPTPLSTEDATGDAPHLVWLLRLAAGRLRSVADDPACCPDRRDLAAACADDADELADQVDDLWG